MIITIAVAGVFAALFLVALYPTFKPVFHPKHVRVVIADVATKRLHTYYLKPLADGTVTIEGHKYLLEAERMYHIGRFQIPTMYFTKGGSEAVNFTALKLTSKLSSKKAHEGQESHVARDLIRAFIGDTVSNLTVVLVVCAVVILAVGLVYWKLGDQMSKMAGQITLISEAVGVDLTPSPDTETEPEPRFN